MNISDYKKRIEEVICRLNEMDNKLHFTLREENYGVFVDAVISGEEHFAIFEPCVMFDDYIDISTAYAELSDKISLLAAGTKLNDPNSYHNR
jgi:hypothetical protein